MDCLDANAVQDLMSGALDPIARTGAIAHLDTCDDCRDLVSLLAREAAHDAAVDTLREHRANGTASTSSSTEALADTAVAGRARRMTDPAATVPSGNRRSARVIQKGRVIGRYTLVERLGAGAMGVVFRAADPELGRDVALKLLHVPDAALTERLVREARSMAKVSHPNVVGVYEVGDDDETTFIAMELVVGSSLRSWQQQNHPIAEILEKYIAAGSGLAAAHAAGVIHRDFKPDNVLVGNDGRARVTDFGLAAFGAASGAAVPAATAKLPPSSFGSTSARSSAGFELVLTQSGTVMGTPAYMAPEQFDSAHVDARTDQFAFCVSLYEALYQQRPFTGKTFEELGDNVGSGNVREPPDGSAVSGTLRAILLKGLAVRPGDRFPSMDHLLAELARDRAKPWRRTAFVAALLAAVLALGIGADFVVRGRVTDEIAQSFAATGVQTNRAFRLLVQQFDANANQMYHQSAMVSLSAHRDEAEFQLGDPADDERNREEIHASLVSTDWSLWRQGIGSESLVLAVADRKGRLFYTSAAPNHWRTNLLEIPWLANLVERGAPRTIVLQRMADPHIAKTGMLGPAPSGTLGFFFAKLHIVNKEITSTIVQSLDAEQLIPEIQLDDEMRLSIVSPDGAHAGSVPESLAAAAPRATSTTARASATAEARYEGEPYLVTSHPLSDRDGATVGHVVMARRLDGVISGFFPGARSVFGGAVIAMIGIAIAAAFRARRVAGRT